MKSWCFAFYWAGGVITGFVPFTISPNDEGMAIFTTVMLFLGLIFNAGIISALTSAVTNVDSANQFTKQKLDRVSQYLQFQGIDPSLRTRIVEFYRYLLQSSQSEDDQQFLMHLPPQLSTQLSIETYRNLVMHCQLFRLLDNQVRNGSSYHSWIA